ncbi:unnamed protein product [Miscanthus lutarioriparius]|uniref:Uncharacterized protein n=1 Tax=Miscanthus lutarioriparius TaxID=422564 RepID=A0A811MWX1_9POAL|nr:unnamed protein product [Miscanthus lutarioriparius]
MAAETAKTVPPWFASRLTGIKENAKFQKKEKKTTDDDKDGGEQQSQMPGLKLLVEEAKRDHGVKYVYVWHAMAGYWGGVKPAAEGMEHYESALAYPVQSPGVMGNQLDIVMDSLSVLGLGLVHPRRELSFYDELHSYLASCGMDGVKVDAQNIIETLRRFGHNDASSAHQRIPPLLRGLDGAQLPATTDASPACATTPTCSTT